MIAIQIHQERVTRKIKYSRGAQVEFGKTIERPESGVQLHIDLAIQNVDKIGFPVAIQISRLDGCRSRWQCRCGSSPEVAPAIIYVSDDAGVQRSAVNANQIGFAVAIHIREHVLRRSQPEGSA